MRLAVLGDVHLIADNDPYTHYHRLRSKFKDGVPSFRRVISWLNGMDLQAVVSLGDLIDYYTDENADFAAEVMSQLKCPWFMTPGNHDLEVPKGGPESKQYDNSSAKEHFEVGVENWRKRGVILNDQIRPIGGFDLMLVDSSCGDVATKSVAWMNKKTTPKSWLFTHVPLNIAAIRNFITEQDPDRDLSIATQDRTPDFFGQCVKGKISRVFTGHLHLAGLVKSDGSNFHLVDGAFSRDGKHHVTLVEVNRGEVLVSTVQAPI
jgi:hypothetical protein